MQERVKIAVRGAIELLIAMTIIQVKDPFDDAGPWLYVFGVYILVSLRAIFSENFDLMTMIFIAAYSMINLLVNTIDYAIFKTQSGYLEDYIFHQMFSYKLFQGVLCLIISFVFAQVLNPSFETIRENP